MAKYKKMHEYLFAAVLILFILQVLLLPVFIGVTYASKSQKPEHIITYGKRRLTWDKDTETDGNGAARLNIFGAVYENAEAENGDKILAPGTEKESIIRLQNTAKNKIAYTAVLYAVNEADLPVTATLSGNGFSDTDSYTLPDSGENAKIIRAVSGEISGGQMQEFDIGWKWLFEDTADADLQDVIDTYFGDDAANDNAADMKLGFHITVNDNGTVITPDSSRTGDNSQIGLYLLLMLVSGITLIILMVERKRNNVKKDS